VNVGRFEADFGAQKLSLWLLVVPFLLPCSSSTGAFLSFDPSVTFVLAQPHRERGFSIIQQRFSSQQAACSAFTKGGISTGIVDFENIKEVCTIPSFGCVVVVGSRPRSPLPFVGTTSRYQQPHSQPHFCDHKLRICIDDIAFTTFDLC